MELLHYHHSKAPCKAGRRRHQRPRRCLLSCTLVGQPDLTSSPECSADGKCARSDGYRQLRACGSSHPAMLSLNAGLKTTARCLALQTAHSSPDSESELQQPMAGSSPLSSGLQAHSGHHLFIDSPRHSGHQCSTEGPGNTAMKEATQPMVL